MILYLHGFRSSPRSKKAMQVRAALRARGREGEFVCPELPVSPREASRVALEAAGGEGGGRPPRAVIGSSLGGYYATWLAERLGCRAALLNPAVRPERDLQAHLGRQTVYFSDRELELAADHLQELRAIDTPSISRPERYFLVAATGDEVLDCKDMLRKYAGCRQRVIEGSNHALSDFERYVDEVVDFCDG